MVEKVSYRTAYFAHPISHYDDDIEWECIETIITMLTPVGKDVTEGWIHIMNPNQRWLSNLYERRLREMDEDPFDIFRQIAISCDVIVGVSFMDGSIGAGVAEEIKTCLLEGIPAYLIYINNGIKLFLPVSNIDNFKILSREETRAKTKEGII